MDNSLWNTHNLYKQRRHYFWDAINNTTLSNNIGNYSQTYYSGSSYINKGNNILSQNYDGYKDSLGNKYTRNEKGLDNKYLEEIDNNGEKHLMLENNRIIKNHNYELEDLPKVYGEGALGKFSNFHSTLKKTGLNLKLIKQFNYYDINRWDILLIDGKLIKLPTENYEKSILKFLEIYEKSSFKKFKIFDFRIKNELIMR